MENIDKIKTSEISFFEMLIIFGKAIYRYKWIVILITFIPTIITFSYLFFSAREFAYLALLRTNNISGNHYNHFLSSYAVAQNHADLIKDDIKKNEALSNTYNSIIENPTDSITNVFISSDKLSSNKLVEPDFSHFKKITIMPMFALLPTQNTNQMSDKFYIDKNLLQIMLSVKAFNNGVGNEFLEKEIYCVKHYLSYALFYDLYQGLYNNELNKLSQCISKKSELEIEKQLLNSNKQHILDDSDFQSGNTISNTTVPVIQFKMDELSERNYGNLLKTIYESSKQFLHNKDFTEILKRNIKENVSKIETNNIEIDVLNFRMNLYRVLLGKEFEKNYNFEFENIVNKMIDEIYNTSKKNLKDNQSAIDLIQKESIIQKERVRFFQNIVDNSIKITNVSKNGIPVPKNTLLYTFIVFCIFGFISFITSILVMYSKNSNKQ